MATYSAQSVAAELRHRLPGLPVKKLHKLLYYCQGQHLAAFGEPLFRESISAYDMGPVVGQLWYAEKQDGPRGRVADEALTEREFNTVGYVVSRYGHLSGADLERLTHAERPWIDADRERRRHESRRERITEDALRDFFTAQAAEDKIDDDDIPLDPHELALMFRGAAERSGASTSLDTPETIRALRR